MLIKFVEHKNNKEVFNFLYCLFERGVNKEQSAKRCILCLYIIQFANGKHITNNNQQ